MERTLLIYVQVSPCLISQLPGIFLLPCHSLNGFLEDHLCPLNSRGQGVFLSQSYLTIWIDSQFCPPLLGCFPPLGWVTLLLLPIPLQSGQAIVISWSSSSHSPSHKGLVPKMQPVPPAHPPTGPVPMLQPEPYFHLTLSFFFEYIYIYIYIYSTIVWFLHFLFIFWPYHSLCRIIMHYPGIELTPPAVFLNHWNLNHWTSREVPFPTHHHPVCFLEAHSQIILENAHLHWNYM